MLFYLLKKSININNLEEKMSNSVCLPDTESKMNDSGKHSSIVENGTTSSTESTSFLKIKRKRNLSKENIHWSLEEEYIFFELHSFLKNKWTNYALLFPQMSKQMKEIKNHFHSCILKTVRRIINNKFDNSVKNIMRSVYSCFYLLTLENKSQSQKVNNNNKKHKYNPKFLFFTKQLTKEMIIKYYDILVKEYFLKNTLIQVILAMKKIQRNSITMDNIKSVFLIVIKAKLITECKRNLNRDDLSAEEIKKLNEYILENADCEIDYSKIERIISINN